jgi:hypothetical protein
VSLYRFPSYSGDDHRRRVLISERCNLWLFKVKRTSVTDSAKMCNEHIVSGVYENLAVIVTGIYSSHRRSFWDKILFSSGLSYSKIFVCVKSHGPKVIVPRHLGHQGLGPDGLLPLLFVKLVTHWTGFPYGLPVRGNRRVLTHWMGSTYGFPGREKLQLSIRCKYRAKNSGGSERTSSMRRYFIALT